MRHVFKLNLVTYFQVDFIWINRDQKAFEWFLTILNQLEVEQSAHPGALEKCMIHLYMTAAQNNMIKMRDVYVMYFQVDFIWINRDQKAFEWFLTILNQLEVEQSAHQGALEK